MTKKDAEGETPLFHVETKNSNPYDNEVSICKADMDGVVIMENIDPEKRVYIYYSEINRVCQELKKEYYEYKNNHSGNRAQAKKKDKNVEGVFHGGFNNLSDYYQSEEWRMLRLRRLRLDGFRCVNCGSQRGLEVHHLSYACVPFESVDVLRTLCGFCHSDVSLLNRGLRCEHGSSGGL
jgi:5-methylcytosine-specific restriction endonuclease McrA